MNNIYHIDESIGKEFTLYADGKAFVSRRGIARLCDVDEITVRRLLDKFDDATASLPKSLEPFAGKSFEGATPLPDTLATSIIEYYAFDAGRYCTDQARLVYRAFGTIGFRTWIQSELGWGTKPATISAVSAVQVPTQAIALCKTLLLEAGIEPPIASSWMLSQYAKYDPDKAAVYEDGKKLLAATADIPEPLLSPTEIGKLLAEHQGLEKPLSAIAVNKLLVDRGFQVQSIEISTKGEKKTWHLTDSGKLYGKIITDTARGHGKTIFHVRWLTKITDLLAA